MIINRLKSIFIPLLDDAMKNHIAMSSKNEHTLKILAKSEWWVIRASVAENPNCPSETLNLLLTDKDWMVVSFAHDNENATEENHLFFRAYQRFGNVTIPELAQDLLRLP